MIKINGLKFAKNDSEFTDSLFQQGGTAYGFYKKVGQGCYHLINIQGDIFAAIVKNKHGFCGIVNTSKQDNGRVFYQYDASEKTRELLGIPAGYIAGIEYAEKLFNELKG